MFRRFTLGGALLAFATYFVLSGSPDTSPDIVWSCNAMGATPTPATVESGLIDALAGRVRFREGKTGTANLICPIGSISDRLAQHTVRSLHLTYRDGDGRTGHSVVSAALRRIDKASGHVETVPNGGVSSNDEDAENSGPEGWASHQSATTGQTIGRGLDFDRNYYYVQITLRQVNEDAPLVVQGVHLTN